MRHLIAIRKTVRNQSSLSFVLSLFLVIIAPVYAQELRTTPRPTGTASPGATVQPTPTAPTPAVTTASVATSPTPTPSESPNTNSAASTATPTATPNPSQASGGARGSFTFGGASGEGPVWFVLIVFGVIVLLAILSYVFARKIKEKMSLSANWIIVLLISGGVIFFFGVWFGWMKSQPVTIQPVPGPLAPSPSPVITPSATLTTVLAPSPSPVPSPNASPAAAPAASPSPSLNASQTAKATPTPYTLSVSQVIVDNDDQVAGLGDTIAITVNNLKEELAREQNLGADAERLDLRRYVLFLNDMEIKKLYPSAFDPELGTLRFKLTRTPESKPVWTNLLAGQGSSIRVTKASVGPEGKTELLSRGTFNLKIYDSTLLTIGVIGFLLGIIGFWSLAKNTSIIRDSGPPEPPPGALRPYSLARSQVAWWFFIILGSFLFIALVTQDFDTLTNSSSCCLA